MKGREASRPTGIQLALSLLAAAGLHVAIFVALPVTGARALQSVVAFSPDVEVSLDQDSNESEAGPMAGATSPPAESAGPGALGSVSPDQVSASKDSRVAPSESVEASGEWEAPYEDPISGSGAALARSRSRGLSRMPLGNASTSLARVEQGARLAPISAACSDLFPYGARVERGEVTATLDVAPDGRVKLLRLERTNSTDERFESAAKICSQRLRFEPARDASGRSVASTAQVKLVFQRQS